MTAARGVCRSDDEKNENVQAKSVSQRRPRPFVYRVGNVKDQLMLNGMT